MKMNTLKFLVISLIVALSSTSLSKSRTCSKGSDCYKGNSSPEEQFWQDEIEPVLQAIQLGNVSISDGTCVSPSHTSTSDLITATIDGQSFYVIKNQSAVTGSNYSPSYCQKITDSSNLVSIDCIAREVNPAALPAKSLSFYMELRLTGQSPNFYNIVKCPQDSP